jgi:hypothetical protein
MRALKTCALVGLLLLAAQSLSAQPATPGGNPDESAENSPAAAVQKKRADCRQEGTTQGLRGPDLVDHVAVCVLEARLTCLKQAIEDKARGPQRRSYMAKCLGG